MFKMYALAHSYYPPKTLADEIYAIGLGYRFIPFSLLFTKIIRTQTVEAFSTIC